MNVLFTTMPYWGGLRPLVPLAHGLRRAGHRVAVAAPGWFAPTIGRHRLDPLAAGGHPVPDEFERGFADLQSRQSDPWGWTFATWVGGFSCQHMAADLLRLAKEWRPDLIIREATEYGGCLAAEALGIPHASVRPRPAVSRLSYQRRAGLRPVLARRRAELDLPPDPDNQMPHRYLELAFLPPWFFGDADQFSDRTHFVNFGVEGLELDSPTGDITQPCWTDGRPCVYASLGTLRYAEPGVMEGIVTALRTEPVNVIVSAGGEDHVTQLSRLAARQSAAIRIKAEVDQLTALRRSDVFVTHAGINSVREALTLGVPMIVVPIGDDQPFNAEHCVALGVAREVKPGDRLVSEIREAVRSLLEVSAYRDASARMRDAIASLPSVRRAVGLLGQLAETGRPIVRDEGPPIQLPRTHEQGGQGLPRDRL